MNLRMTVVIGLLCAIPAAAVAATAQPPQSAAGPAREEAVIGTVQTVKGAAFILRGGQRLPAERGTRLQARDVVRTGKGAALGLVLRDETAISLGPSSELALREFVYKPSEGLFASVLSFVRGTMVYIAGRMARLAPSSNRIETPVGVAAARGTKFLIVIPE